MDVGIMGPNQTTTSNLEKTFEGTIPHALLYFYIHNVIYKLDKKDCVLNICSQDSEHITTYFGQYFYVYTTFYYLKVTFGYIGESPENFMSKYTHEVSVF